MRNSKKAEFLTLTIDSVDWLMIPLLSDWNPSFRWWCIEEIAETTTTNSPLQTNQGAITCGRLPLQISPPPSPRRFLRSIGVVQRSGGRSSVECGTPPLLPLPQWAARSKRERERDDMWRDQRDVASWEYIAEMRVEWETKRTIKVLRLLQL